MNNNKKKNLTECFYNISDKKIKTCKHPYNILYRRSKQCKFYISYRHTLPVQSFEDNDLVRIVILLGITTLVIAIIIFVLYHKRECKRLEVLLFVRFYIFKDPNKKKLKKDSFKEYNV